MAAGAARAATTAAAAAAAADAFSGDTEAPAVEGSPPSPITLEQLDAERAAKNRKRGDMIIAAIILLLGAAAVFTLLLCIQIYKPTGRQ